MSFSDNRLAPENDGEILDAFAELLSELVPDEPEEIDALLREVELDPEQVEKEASAFISGVRSATPLDWRNKQKEISEVITLYERVGASLPFDHQDLLDIWQQLTSRPQAKRVLAEIRHRNQRPEDLSKEELRSLIQDIQFVLSENEGGLDQDFKE